MENHGSVDDVDDVDKESSGDGIQEHDFAEEFSPASPNLVMSSSAPSGFSLYALLQLPTESKVDNCDVAHAGSVSDTKKLEHAPPSEPMPSTGLGMMDSSERTPTDSASDHDVAPAAFPVEPTSRNTATSRIFRSPIGSHDSPSELANEESKQEDGPPSSAGAHPNAHDGSRVATESGLYAEEAQRVPDGNKDRTVAVAETQYLNLKWYQRRWISLGVVCCLIGTVVVIVVLVLRQPAEATMSSLTSPTTVPTRAPPTTAPTRAPPTTAPTRAPPTTAPTRAIPTTAPTRATPTTAPIRGGPATTDPTAAPFTPKPNSTASPITTSKPTSLTPLAVACSFISIPNVTKCRSTFVFDPYDNGDRTTGLKIPSEIGLLTQLTFLSFFGNALTSTIPSEIGLLKKLTWLDFDFSGLTSTIPSEIGSLTQLNVLSFYSNQLISTIPIEIGRLSLLTALSFDSNALSSRIPSEIGLLARLTYLFLSNNELTSTIPSEIGLLTQLKMLSFFGNTLKGTIPSSLCSLPSLYGKLGIDCGEITCASGCCMDGTTLSSCG
ncbi:hypothetical protein MHU86_25502 [Fragilaria crotonensis]|nr:hypothetical protein MHU86_25502 [Fragilaria crotonensis]